MTTTQTDVTPAITLTDTASLKVAELLPEGLEERRTVTAHLHGLAVEVELYGQIS